MIKYLPEDVINQIAAGEVIERPASVVKELVENAIDAGSTRITVEIERAGQDLIRVSDNGDGMTHEELLLATERHATSKLTSTDDLLTLRTLGFRGEALPSIAAVSRFTAISQSKNPKLPSWTTAYAGGKKLKDIQSSRPCGTTIEVRDLFFNTPARKKFLKKDTTETSHIIRMMDELCLAYPHIAFKLVSNKREIINVYASDDIFKRARDVLGKSLYEKLIPVNADYAWIHIKGLVSKISLLSSSRADQYCYINRRPIFSRTISRSLYDSYKDHAPDGKHPSFVFWLDINTELVDVNVHPTKREVRLTKENELYQVLRDSVRRQISSVEAMPAYAIPADATRSFIQQEQPHQQRVQEAVEDFYSKHSNLVKQAFKPYQKQHIDEPELIPQRSFNDTSFRVIGQFSALYVLAEANNELWIVDQHAAEERVLFELFSSRLISHRESQKLLIPYHWDMSAEKFSIIKPLLKELNDLGIMIEEFGTHSVVVRAIPSYLGEIKEVHSFLELLVEHISVEKGITDTDHIPRRESIISAACRAAVKSRDMLSGPQICELIKKLQQCAQPLTCPHGRPTLIRLSKHEIDRRFGR